MTPKLAPAALALLLAAAPAFAAEPALTKADVERIVHDYIQAHPEEIIDAVQSYQDGTARAQQAEAVRSNSKGLYDDPGAPVLGNPKGDVTLVEFFDYNCGYCKKVMPHVAELIGSDKNLRVIFKEYPILSPTSEVAAKWALAANRQGKYFEFHQALMDNRAPIDEALLEKVAKDTGLDLDKMRADAKSETINKQILADRALGAGMGLRGTPAFVIGDEVSPGAISIDEMRRLIAKARAKQKGG